MRVGRGAVLRPLLAAALTSIAGLDNLAARPMFDKSSGQIRRLDFVPSASAALVPATTARPASQAQVTSKIFLDVRIIKRFDVEVLEDAAIRGRIVIGLFGKDAPLAVERFLNFVNDAFVEDSLSLELHLHPR